MKRTLLALIVVAAPCLSLAAPADSTTSTRANSLRDGAWAMQFSFESGFNGGRISLKHHFAPKDAFRVGFSAYGQLRDEEGSSPAGAGQFESDYVQLEFEALYLRYPRPFASVNVFFGAGPFVDWRERSEQRVETDEQQFAEENSTEIGIVATIGAEWFISEALSLHIEYAMSAGHTKGERTTTYSSVSQPTETYETEFDGWQLDAGRSVFFGLGMYF